MAPARNGRIRRQATAQSNEEGADSGNDEQQGGGDERVQRTKTKKSGRASRVNGETEQRDELPPIDILNFSNQPLNRSDGAKIGQIAGDWQKVSVNVRESAIALVKEIGEAMAEAGMGEDNGPAQKELAKIEIAMSDLLTTQAKLNAHHDSLHELHEAVVQGEEITDIVERYEQGVARKNEEWDKKTSRQKYGKDDDFISFKQRIFEVQNPDTAMPPISSFLPAEDGDESDDDDDIQVGGMTQDYKCPLTLTTLVNPVTSRSCKHSFSKNAIREFFKNNRQVPKRCPASGCSQMLSLQDFEDDKDLEKRVTAYSRRERRREAEADSGSDDAEEIID